MSAFRNVEDSNVTRCTLGVASKRDTEVASEMGTSVSDRRSSVVDVGVCT